MRVEGRLGGRSNGDLYTRTLESVQSGLRAVLDATAAASEAVRWVRSRIRALRSLGKGMQC